MQKAFRLQINNRKVLKNNLLTVETWFIYRRKNDDNFMKQLNTDHEEGSKVSVCSPTINDNANSEAKER